MSAYVAAEKSDEAEGECNAEMQEAFVELRRQRQLCLKAEAAADEHRRRAHDLRKQVATLPSKDVVDTLRTQLSEEVKLRERCRVELEELRAKPRTDGVARRNLERLMEESARLKSELIQEQESEWKELEEAERREVAKRVMAVASPLRSMARSSSRRKAAAGGG